MQESVPKCDQDLTSLALPHLSAPISLAAPISPPINIPLTTLPAHPCPYLPGLEATMRAFRTDKLPGPLYHDFMNAGFRRSGKVIYQPICQSCRQCVPLRVPVDRFTPNKSQRRSARRNADLTLTIDVPVSTEEKFRLYQLYQEQWHHRQAEAGEDARHSFDSFLYDSPVDSLEFCYRSSGRLVAVGIADVCPESFSSVYHYFDPSLGNRSLGTFGALQELRWAKQHNIPFYYLGFWVKGCGKMAYKANYHPCQLLAADGSWRDAERLIPEKKRSDP